MPALPALLPPLPEPPLPDIPLEPALPPVLITVEVSSSSQPTAMRPARVNRPASVAIEPRAAETRRGPATREFLGVFELEVLVWACRRIVVPLCGESSPRAIQGFRYLDGAAPSTANGRCALSRRGLCGFLSR